MKKSFGLILAVGLMAAFGAQGAAVTCASLSGGTLSALIAATNGTSGGTANVCTVDDKIFSNVSYSGNGALVTANLEANSVTQSYGWGFLSNFTSNFTLGYTVAIDTGICLNCRIVSAIEQIVPGQNPPGTQDVSVNEGGITTVDVNNATFAGNSNGASVGSITSLSKAATATGLSSTSSIQSFETLVRQSSIPEPMTFSLMGVGLLGLGLLRKRIG